jgi:hypothetical protein
MQPTHMSTLMTPWCFSLAPQTTAQGFTQVPAAGFGSLLKVLAGSVVVLALAANKGEPEVLKTLAMTSPKEVSALVSVGNLSAAPCDVGDFVWLAPGLWPLLVNLSDHSRAVIAFGPITSKSALQRTPASRASALARFGAQWL